jgi:glycosyltransferase involved in cell wall biosynthesis
MNIHFSNVNFSSSSGPNSFAYRLANELTHRGYKIVNSSEDYDVFLCFIEPDSKPNKKAKFIHRLDGIWFKPDQFIDNNKNILWAYKNCDHVVWQSDFDKKMTQFHWDKPKKGTVIHNGISEYTCDNLHPDLVKIKNSFDNIFVCAASWHRQKRLKENIEFYIKNRNKNDAMFVLGHNPDYIISAKNLFYLGSLSHELCLQFYSFSNWFLHLAWLDHCPNVVVEALSMNCPVVCTDSGGTMEIVGKNGVIIKEKKPYNFELADYDNPYDIHIEKIILPKVNVNSDHLDIKLVCDKYEKVFKWD